MPISVSTLTEEITKAIAAHGSWKYHLRSAITAGKSASTPAMVCQDNQCDFGKWLYSLDASLQRSPRCQAVKSLHAEFHREAARVLQLALNGQVREAEDALSFSSQFTAISAKLTAEMMAWRKNSA